MSAGHHHGHPIRAEEAAKAVAMLKERRFQAALRRYTKADNSHRIVFLAGSDNEGETVFYDKDLPQKLKLRRKDGRLEATDPRRFLWWHEAPEGVLIRLYGFDYDKAHLYATAIEKRHVEAAGFDWNDYERKLEPFVHDDEGDSAKGTPKNLLTLAYRNSRWWPEIEKAGIMYLTY